MVAMATAMADIRSQQRLSGLCLWNGGGERDRWIARVAASDG